MNELMAEPANGKVMRSTRKMAMIFGTKTSVISWICVSAWIRPMPIPTMSAMIMAGAAISRSTQMLSRAKSMESAGVMCSLGSDRHLHDGLVGLDDLVADGDDGIQRDFRLVHGVDDIDDVALARDLLRGGLFTRFHRADGILHRAGEKITEAGTLRGAGLCGGAAEFARSLISGVGDRR